MSHISETTSDSTANSPPKMRIDQPSEDENIRLFVRLSSEEENFVLQCLFCDSISARDRSSRTTSSD
jgi:hypothetical protein